MAKRRPNAKCGKKHVVPVCIERQNQTKYSQTKLIAKHGPSKCIIMARKEVEDGQNSFLKYSWINMAHVCIFSSFASDYSSIVNLARKIKLVILPDHIYQGTRLINKVEFP